jgi:hypothetical protein
MHFPDRLLNDLEWFGFLFESLVTNGLRVLTQAMDGEVFHCRINMSWKQMQSCSFVNKLILKAQGSLLSFYVAGGHVITDKT